MKKKFIHDISANTLQVIINQLCGLGIFYALSSHLDKSNFGEINWSLAVLLTIFGILACGIDQVAVRRIAVGQDARVVLSVYISHVLFSGLLVYGLLLAGRFVFPGFFARHHLLLLLGIGKLMIFFSSPFKQLVTGMEKFRPLLYMAVSSNIVRSLALLLFVAFSSLNLPVIIIIFIAGDLVELLACIYITQRIVKIPVSLQRNKREYASLLKESMPQLGVTVFTAIIARFDWILLGLLTTPVILANYSFAYKIFEVATLPMMIVAPVLIPQFAKIFRPNAEDLLATRVNDLFVLLRIEMLIASFVGLVLNILWVPVIDFITTGKYGLVNRFSILMLSSTMPFLYLNNFLWTINFAKGRLKMIFYVFAITFIINITTDIILIHFFNAAGAAVAYLITIVIQSLLYFFQTKLDGLKSACLPVLLCPIAAIASGYLAITVFHTSWMQLLSACFTFFLLLILTRQLMVSDRLIFKRVLGL